MEDKLSQAGTLDFELGGFLVISYLEGVVGLGGYGVFSHYVVLAAATALAAFGGCDIDSYCGTAGYPGLCKEEFNRIAVALNSGFLLVDQIPGFIHNMKT